MTVLNLPLPKRTCYRCRHYLDMAGGGYCEVYEEAIDSEVAAAKDCEWYWPEPPEVNDSFVWMGPGR